MSASSYTLLDVPEFQKEHPEYPAPPLNYCEKLNEEYFAKVVLTDTPGTDGERVWVSIEFVDEGPRFAGKLSNDPIADTSGLSWGDTIEFGPENVVDYMRKDESDERE